MTSGAVDGVRHEIGGEGGGVQWCEISNVDTAVAIINDPLDFYVSNMYSMVLDSTISAARRGVHVVYKWYGVLAAV